MSNQTKLAELCLLADRLRRINDQPVISLARAQEVCVRLGEIIHLLNELDAITFDTMPNRDDVILLQVPD